MRASERISGDIARSMLRRPGAWIASVAILFALLLGAGLYKAHNTRQQELAASAAKKAAAEKQAEAQAAQAQERAAQAMARKRACEQDLNGITQQAQRLLKENKPSQAIETLRNCEPFAEKSAQAALLQRAINANSKILEDARKATEAMHRARRAELWPAIGMSPEDVAQGRWGKPERINRTTTANGVREQWVYSQGYLYFDNGRLSAIQD